LNLVSVKPDPKRPTVEFLVVNIGAGSNVPTGSNRRASYLQAELLDTTGKIVATNEWMFALWYGNRPNDRNF
jgi:hypothetical protein